MTRKPSLVYLESTSSKSIGNVCDLHKVEIISGDPLTNALNLPSN